MWQSYDVFIHWMHEHSVILNLMYNNKRIKNKCTTLLLFLKPIYLKKNYFLDNKQIESTFCSFFFNELEQSLSTGILFFDDIFFIDTATYLFLWLDLSRIYTIWIIDNQLKKINIFNILLYNVKSRFTLKTKSNSVDKV